jgi:hypothetical protein
VKTPLFYLNNRPVYKDDILYWECGGGWEQHKVHHVDENDRVWDCEEDDACGRDSRGWLTINDLRESPNGKINKSGWIYLYNHENTVLLVHQI